VPVYPIGLGGNLNLTKKQLLRIAESTGGFALFAPTSGELGQAYQAISDQLRNQYAIRYLSPAPRGAKSYQLAVKAGRFPDAATGEATFEAAPQPPTIRGLTLQDGAELTGPADFVVKSDAARPITEVRLEEGPPPRVREAPSLSLPAFGFEGVLEVVAQGIPHAISFPGETLLASLVLFTSSVAVFRRSRRVVPMPPARVPGVTCPQCGGVYGGHEEAEETRTIATLLVENGLVSEGDIKTCLAASERSKRPLEDVLLEQGRVTTGQLNQAAFYLSRSIQMAERLVIAGQAKRQWL